MHPKNLIKTHFFPLYILYLRARTWFEYSTERQLLTGKSVSTVARPSVCLFTVHKSASTFLGRLLDELSLASGMARADFDSYFANLQTSVVEQFEKPGFYQRAYREKGIIYGPHRSYRHIPNLDSYKVLLVLRDPRDVLVSNYYSIAFSHPIVSKRIIDRRKEALSQTIDEFVLARAPKFLNRYREYCDKLCTNPCCLVCKYDEMIRDPMGFLDKIQSFLEITLPENVTYRIATQELTLPKAEDIHRHRRSGKPGAYITRLRPDTVSILNELFDKPLRTLNFNDISGRER